MNNELENRSTEEWEAWQVICRELEKLLGYSVNDLRVRPTCKAIIAWGDLLVALRDCQKRKGY